MENTGYVIHDYRDGNRMTREDGTEISTGTFKLAPPPDPVVGRSRLVIQEDEYGNRRTVTLVFLRNGQVLWEMPESPEGMPALNADEYFPPLKPLNLWEM